MFSRTCGVLVEFEAHHHNMKNKFTHLELQATFKGNLVNVILIKLLIYYII
jgi:hypothetical protein